MNVLITGDSHTAALKNGQNLLISHGEWPQHIDLTVKPLGSAEFFPTPFFVDKGDYAEINNVEFCKRFKQFPPADHKNSSIIYGFSGLFHTAGIRRHPAWTKFAPAHLIRDESPVSNTLLRRTIQDRTQYLLKFVDIILRTTDRLFVIEAPKPFRHAKALQTIRPEVISYIDGYYRELVKLELKARNIPIIALGSECYDEAGFMHEQYRHANNKDQHHGNAEYGRIMMKKILDFIINQY